MGARSGSTAAGAAAYNRDPHRRLGTRPGRVSEVNDTRKRAQRPGCHASVPYIVSPNELARLRPEMS